MKKVIDGKLYNTETATKVANWDNGLGGNDFRNIDESLYITKNGRFFLAGEGGPMTKYSQPAGNMTSGGSGIIPLIKEDALGWCEEHGVKVDVIQKYFPELVEEA